MEHLLSAYGPPAPQPPWCCPLEMAAAWECGWGPPGRRLLDRGLSVELLGSFPGAQTHDWTSENASHYPTHRAQRGHAGAWQARRPGWVHGGLWFPTTEGKDVPRVERAALTRRNENHFLQPWGRQRQREMTRDLPPQPRAGHSSSAVKPGLKGHAPLLTPEGIQQRQRREHSRTPKVWRPPSFLRHLQWGRQQSHARGTTRL